MKCPHCDRVPYPLRGVDGRVIKRNLWRLDWMNVLWVVMIVFLAWSYRHDVAACEQVMEDPAGFCEPWCASISSVGVVDRGFMFNISIGEQIGS